MIPVAVKNLKLLTNIIAIKKFLNYYPDFFKNNEKIFKNVIIYLQEKIPVNAFDKLISSNKNINFEFLHLNVIRLNDDEADEDHFFQNSDEEEKQIIEKKRIGKGFVCDDDEFMHDSDEMEFNDNLSYIASNILDKINDKKEHFKIGNKRKRNDDEDFEMDENKERNGKDNFNNKKEKFEEEQKKNINNKIKSLEDIIEYADNDINEDNKSV